MSRSEPPAAATWMLEHLTLGNMKEAVAGDLLEEFAQGRSAAWYWRQVLLAVLMSRRNELRAVCFGLGFALLWTAAVTLYWGRIFAAIFPHVLGSLSSTSVRLQWPWSVTYEIAAWAALSAIPIVVGLSQYLLLLKRFSLAGFFRGVGIISLLEVIRAWSMFTFRPGRASSVAMFFAILALSMRAALKAEKDEARSPLRPLSE